MADKGKEDGKPDPARKRKFQWRDGDVKWLVPPRQVEDPGPGEFNVRTRSRDDQD